MDHDGMWLVDWKGGVPNCGEEGWDLGEAHSARTESRRWN